MKIIYLHQYFTLPDMPGGTRSFSLARRLVALGHEVHMVTTDRSAKATDHGGRWRESEEAGIRVHWTPVAYTNRMSSMQRIAAFVKFATRAARRARSLQGDVVFATSTPLTIALPGVYAARRNRIPMVFEVRDLWPAVPIALGILRSGVSKRLALWLERFAYRHSERIVALAPGMKDAVAQCGYPEDNITVIPNGADADIFIPDAGGAAQLRARYEWLGNRKLVLYCGAIGRINGVDYLASLAAEVAKLDPEIRFAVIGEGALKDRVSETASAAGVLDKSFFMLGALPKRDVTDWHFASTMTTALITGPPITWKDATQNKFFDSLAAGKPVASNFLGWQCHIANEEGVGIVLPSDDLEEAARLLCETLADEPWLARACANAKRLAATRFSMDSHAVALEKVLGEAVDAFASRGEGGALTRAHSDAPATAAAQVNSRWECRDCGRSGPAGLTLSRATRALQESACGIYCQIVGRSATSESASR